MPWAPRKPCQHPMCPELSDGSYCPAHKPVRKPWRGGAGGHGYGRQWRKIRDQVLTEEPYCRLCRAPATEVDHIVARARGGRDGRANLRGLCRSCHAIKTRRR